METEGMNHSTEPPTSAVRSEPSMAAASEMNAGGAHATIPSTSASDVQKSPPSMIRTKPATIISPAEKPAVYSPFVPGTSPDASPTMCQSAGPKLMTNNNVKLESVKAWTLSTYKCTRQLLSEKLGKGTRTVDVELDQQVELIRDTQRKYEEIIRLIRAFTSHFNNMIQTQKLLGDSFTDMALKAPELQEEFNANAETQRALVKNGERLMTALDFFTSSVNTLVHKTMTDTLATHKLYVTARLEYDAYRSDFEGLRSLAQRDPGYTNKVKENESVYLQYKHNFEKYRSDLSVKIRLLEENKVKVMHKQLVLLHKAMSAYFAGNSEALEGTMKQFSINMTKPDYHPPSWLENLTHP